jgi:predicted enzyme related to lactoylglutathione lyase
MARSLRASLAFINIPSDQPAQTRDFYQELFGIELAPSLSDDEGYHAPISEDGIDLNINIRHTPEEAAMAFIAVNDLQRALDMAQGAGGQVVWGPEDLPIPDDDLDEYRAAARELESVLVPDNSMGRAAIVVDPGGSQVGFVQLEGHAQRHFRVGPFQQPLDDHQERVHERSMRLGRRRRRGGRLPR